MLVYFLCILFVHRPLHKSYCNSSVALADVRYDMDLQEGLGGDECPTLWGTQ